MSKPQFSGNPSPLKAGDTSTTNSKLTIEKIAQDLLAEGWISRLQYNLLVEPSEILRYAKVHPLINIAERQWQSAATPSFKISIDWLSAWLAKKSGLPYARIDPLRTDFVHLTRFVSFAYAERFNILPIEYKDGVLTIATAEPAVQEWQNELEQALHLEIRRVFANPQDITRYLHEFYALQYSIEEAGKSHQVEAHNKLHDFEQLLELGKREKLDVGNQHVVLIVDWLLQYAFEQRASDIHLEPRRASSRIRFRIDGLLHLVHEVPTTVMIAIISRLKMLGRMNLAERRRPQDGRIKTLVPATGKSVELRLSTMPTTFGEKLVARIFNPEVLVKDFQQLGFSKRDISLWNKMTRQTNGIILVTGPTGSGKTSTLYSAMKHLARPEVNICTVEDPIEIVDADFNQMQVNHTIGVDFASGVRTLLRQDPDIIMVGEIRDRETAEVSIQAALTGHLVLSTLHTSDSVSAITRLLDLGVPSYLINATLLGVAAQRLVRTLCPKCKQWQKPALHPWQALIAPQNSPLPEKVSVPGGCEECRQTGYKGRMGLFEILIIDETVQKMTTANASLSEIRRYALQHGWRPLRLSGAEKIIAGLTTFEEVFSVVNLEE